MKYCMVLLLLFVGCNYITKDDCLKSCDKMCDNKIEAIKKVDLFLGCEQGCQYMVAPCAEIGVVVGWGKNEAITYCLHMFHECKKICKKKYVRK